jgi:hypothetical protein
LIKALLFLYLFSSEPLFTFLSSFEANDIANMKKKEKKMGAYYPDSCFPPNK